MNKNTNLKRIFTPAIIYFCIVILLIFMQHYLNILSMPLSFYTLISIFVFALHKIEISTQFLIMLVPFSNAVHIKEIAVFYVFIIFVKIFCAEKEKFGINTSVLFSFVAVLVLQFASGLRCNDSLATLIYLAAVMGCILLWSRDFFEKEQCYVFLESYIIAFAFMAIFMIAITLKMAPMRQILNGFVRLGEYSHFEYGAFHTGANGLGLMSLFSTSIICYLLSRKKIIKAEAVSLLLLFAITGFLTQSRAFIVGCLFLVIYLAFFYSTSLLNAVKIIAIVSIACSTVIFIIQSLYPNILSHYVERFLVDDITNGRADLMTGYFSSLFNDPISLIFGAGLQTYHNVLGKNVGYISSHNATQEVILAWGLLGLIAVVVWFVSLVRSRGIANQKGGKMRSLLPLFILILMVQSTRMFRTYSSIFLLGISLFCINHAEEGSQ